MTVYNRLLHDTDPKYLIGAQRPEIFNDDDVVYHFRAVKADRLHATILSAGEENIHFEEIVNMMKDVKEMKEKICELEKENEYIKEKLEYCYGFIQLFSELKGYNFNTNKTTIK